MDHGIRQTFVLGLVVVRHGFGPSFDAQYTS